MNKAHKARIMSLMGLLIASVIVFAVFHSSSQVVLSEEGERVVLEDSLTNHSTVGNQHGGYFTDEGWKTSGERDYIEYVLDHTVSKGSFEFDVKGFGPSHDIFTADDHKQHFAGMYDGSYDPTEYGYGSWAKIKYNPYKAIERIYGYDETDTDHVKWGHLKLRLNVAEYDDPTNGANCFEAYTEDWWDWDPDTWYHFKLVWGDGLMTWYKDGEQILQFDYSGTGEEYAPPQHVIRLGYLYYDVPIGITFKNLVVKEFVDTTPPTVVSTTPQNGETNVSPVSDIGIEFSESMDKDSAESSFSISPSVSGEFTWSGKTMYFDPNGPLNPNTTYTVTISTEAKDQSGNSLESPYSFSFTTGSYIPSSAKTYEPYEIILKTTNSYSNPYKDVWVNAEFTSPSGNTLNIDGFWFEENIWMVRIAPTETGHWTFNITSNDSQLTASGGFDVSSSSNHGFIERDPNNPYTWRYSDGTPYFWMGDTSWRGFTNLVSYDGRFKPYIDKRSSQKFNHVHSIVVSYIGGVDRWQNEGGHVFEVNGDEFDFDKLNPKYFKWMDKRIRYANQKGVSYGIYFTWAQEYVKFSYEQFQKFADYIVARFAGYNVIWTICGEYNEVYEDYPDFDPHFVEQAQNVYDKDPYKHPITYHPSGGDSSREFADYTWMGYIAQQLKDGDRHGFILQDRHYNKPVVNEEYGYVDKDFDDDNDARKQAWAINTAGGYFTAGFCKTYAPDKCGWDVDAYSTETSWFTNLYNFFTQKTEYNKLSPNDNLITSGSGYAIAETGRQYVVYLPNGGSVSVDLSGASGTLNYQWFNPRTGEYYSESTVEGGATRSFNPPFSGDAVLLIKSSDVGGGGGGGEQEQTCSEQGGSCCASNEVCDGGSFVSASDCSSCCVNGTCQQEQQTCADQGGSCCSSDQVCEGGSFVSSSDCGNNCCVNGTCQQEQQTCADQGGSCCAANETCEGGSFTSSSDCGDSCCINGTCQQQEQTCSEQGGSCCSDGQICEGGSFVSSSDCSNCCVNGTCQQEQQTCADQGGNCCSNTQVCENGDFAQEASDCDNSCCLNGVCQNTIVSNLTPSNYQTDYLHEGDEYYIDRNYTIVDIPQDYEDLLWIKTANDDKFETANPWVTFDVSKDVIVYVGYDSRYNPPSWMDSWQSTGDRIEVTDKAQYLNLYKKEFSQGTVTLGGNECSNNSCSMYVVLIRENETSGGEGGNEGGQGDEGGNEGGGNEGGEEQEEAPSPDINQDGKVDVRDLGILMSYWGTDNASTDLNQDGIVNEEDFGIIKENWSPY